MPPPPLIGRGGDEDLVEWSAEVMASPLDARRRVYCNRSLNMNRIKAIGKRQRRRGGSGGGGWGGALRDEGGGASRAATPKPAGFDMDYTLSQ